jgi:uncharacterized membrane protein YhhN
MRRRLLTILTILSAILTIVFHYVGLEWIKYIFKPLTTVLILIIALTGGAKSARAYKTAVVVGLVFSLIGDVLLMLPMDLFMFGLISFLIAQVCYIVAFTSGKGFSFKLPSLLVTLVYGIIVYLMLSANLGDMRVPVIIYMIVIFTMVWQAWERKQAFGDRAALFAFIGAALFVLADTSLAMNRFRGEFAAERALTLVLYFTAQGFIVSSVV